MNVDPAVALTAAYLQLNGYFMITEQELHVRDPAGFHAFTDIDVIALRPPTARGPVHHEHGQSIEECLIVTEIDPALGIATDRFDVIIGEVKTGKADFNPGLLTAGALHATLRRTGDLHSTPLDEVVDELIERGSVVTSTARTRLVVFAGHGTAVGAETVHLRDAEQFIRGHLRTHEEMYRVTRFSDPVVALLELFEKIR